MLYSKVTDIVKHLNLDILNSSTKMGNSKVYLAEVARPGLQLAGFFDWFSPERIQVIGHSETNYLNTLSNELKRERLEEFFSYDIPAVVLANGVDADEMIVEIAKKNDVNLLRTEVQSMKFINIAINYLEDQLAPECTIHGVCVEVFGVGVLIRGQSGVGKSETALELLKRGHRLIADDAVIIRRLENRLKASCPELTKNLMEVRGLGILDIKSLFGVGAVKIDQFINLRINLEDWDDKKEYDRLGIDEEQDFILDVGIPLVTIPVKPGRNIATIIEIACKNHRQKLLGFDTLDLYNRRFRGMVED